MYILLVFVEYCVDWKRITFAHLIKHQYTRSCLCSPSLCLCLDVGPCKSRYPHRMSRLSRMSLHNKPIAAAAAAGYDPHPLRSKSSRAFLPTCAYIRGCLLYYVCSTYFAPYEVNRANQNSAYTRYAYINISLCLFPNCAYMLCCSLCIQPLWCYVWETSPWRPISMICRSLFNQSLRNTFTLILII